MHDDQIIDDEFLSEQSQINDNVLRSLRGLGTIAYMLGAMIVLQAISWFANFGIDFFGDALSENRDSGSYKYVMLNVFLTAISITLSIVTAVFLFLIGRTASVASRNGNPQESLWIQLFKSMRNYMALGLLGGFVWIFSILIYLVFQWM